MIFRQLDHTSQKVSYSEVSFGSHLPLWYLYFLKGLKKWLKFFLHKGKDLLGLPINAQTLAKLNKEHRLKPCQDLWRWSSSLPGFLSLWWLFFFSPLSFSFSFFKKTPPILYLNPSYLERREGHSLHQKHPH